MDILDTQLVVVVTGRLASDRGGGGESELVPSSKGSVEVYRAQAKEANGKAKKHLKSSQGRV